MIRRVVPFTVLPLALLASGLASSPWLRAFPFAVIAAPLFGAAVLSALVPFVAVRLGIRWLSLTALIDVAGFVLYELIVALHEPTGTADLVRGRWSVPGRCWSRRSPWPGWPARSAASAWPADGSPFCPTARAW